VPWLADEGVCLSVIVKAKPNIGRIV